jgi:hypothetical protein
MAPTSLPIGPLPGGTPPRTPPTDAPGSSIRKAFAARGRGLLGSWTVRAARGFSRSRVVCSRRCGPGPAARAGVVCSPFRVCCVGWPEAMPAKGGLGPSLRSARGGSLAPRGCSTRLARRAARAGPGGSEIRPLCCTARGPVQYITAVFRPLRLLARSLPRARLAARILLALLQARILLAQLHQRPRRPPPTGPTPGRPVGGGSHDSTNGNQRPTTHPLPIDKARFTPQAVVVHPAPTRATPGVVPEYSKGMTQ